MNPYLEDLQTRAPGLFTADHTTYDGEYVYGDVIETWDSRVAWQGVSHISYTVTAQHGAGTMNATIDVPLEAAPDFEAAIQRRIKEMHA